MKRNLFYLLSFATACSFIVSCATEKSFSKPYENEEAAGLEPKQTAFIITRDGKQYNGSEITFSKVNSLRARQKEDWIAIDGRQFPSRDVIVYQTPTTYRALIDRPWTSNTVKVNYTLSDSIFINRIRRGKIELFTFEHPSKMSNDVRGNYHAYAFKKGNSGINMLEFQNFLAAISDNVAAASRFKSEFPEGKISVYNEKGNLKGLLAVVDIYNR